METKPKKLFNRFAKITAVVLSIIFLSAGCGGGGSSSTQSGQVVLNIWMPFEDSQNLEPLFEAYRQKYPNVQIVYTKKNIENYQQDLLDALASGNGPDIFSIHNDWLPQYQDKITPAPDKTFTLREYKDTFVDVLANDFINDNKIYGTALSVDSLGLYYNKDLLGTAGIATPPKTWSELATQVQKIKRSDGKGYFTRSGVAMGTNTNVNRAVDILYLSMLQQRAGDFSADRTQAVFGQSVSKNNNYTNPGAAALDFYTSFANPASPNYNWNMRSDYSVDAFANGRAAFLYSYSYMRSTLLQKNPNLNFAVASVPQPDLEQTTINFANYWGVVVSKQSKNQTAAWNFLKIITSRDSLDKYYAANKQPSSRKDLIELQIQDPDIGVFANANLTAKSFYKPDQQKLDDIFGKMIDNVILNGLSIEDSLAQAQQEAATIARDQ